MLDGGEDGGCVKRLSVQEGQGVVGLTIYVRRSAAGLELSLIHI